MDQIVPDDSQFRRLVDHAAGYVKANAFRAPEMFWSGFADWCDGLGYVDQHQRLGVYAVVLAVRDGKIIVRQEGG
jgi:hypothetical protein